MQPVFGREGDPTQAVIIASSSIFDRSVPEIAILSAPEFATYRNLSISSFQNLQFQDVKFLRFWIPSGFGCQVDCQVPVMMLNFIGSISAGFDTTIATVVLQGLFAP